MHQRQKITNGCLNPQTTRGGCDMGYLFQHGFAAGMGPFVTRHALGQDLPAADDCARIGRGRLVLRMRRNPLRTGHVWVPPEVFTFVHGFVEARMRFPSPRGSHGAGWLQAFPPYATEEHHEVDYAEHGGNPNVIQHAVWRRPPDHGFDQLVPVRGATKTDANTWAVYGVECRPDGYTFTLNDKPTFEVALPSSEPKTLVFSMLSDQWERDRYPVNYDALWAHNLKVDWIRVSTT